MNNKIIISYNINNNSIIMAHCLEQMTEYYTSIVPGGSRREDTILGTSVRV